MSKPANISVRTSVHVHSDILEVIQKDLFDAKKSVSVTFNREAALALRDIVDRFLGDRTVGKKKAPASGAPGPVREEGKRPNGRHGKHTS